jgi:hypothetical protein
MEQSKHGAWSRRRRREKQEAGKQGARSTERQAQSVADNQRSEIRRNISDFGLRIVRTAWSAELRDSDIL